MRKGGRLQWEGVVRSLQCREGLPLHIGGRFALALQGHEHYLRLGEAATISLFGSARMAVARPARWGELGARQACPGARWGRLHPTYQITLPGDLDGHLG